MDLTGAQEMLPLLPCLGGEHTVWGPQTGVED